MDIDTHQRDGYVEFQFSDGRTGQGIIKSRIVGG
jgi:hypothetical protein